MRNKCSVVLVCLVLALASLSGCDKKAKIKVPADEKPVVNVNVPQFNPDSAYSYIQRQVEFGHRVPNLPSHSNCRKYLVEKLKSYKADVIEQEFVSDAFNGKKLFLTNIIASFKPESKKRILLAAHWDTRPFAEKDSIRKREPIDGANDGGSGVGVLLEIARALSTSPSYNVGVDIIFFDGEDYGDTTSNVKETYCLGSQYWGKNKHKSDYSAYYGILLDMVGAKDAKFPQEQYSLKYASQVVNTVWTSAQSLGYENYFVGYQDGMITDDHRYVNELAKIPMIDIIDLRPLSGFGEYHHTHGDNMSIIDKNTLKAVGQTVLYVLYNEPPPGNI